MVTLTPYGGLDFTFVGAGSDTSRLQPGPPLHGTLAGQTTRWMRSRTPASYRRVKLGDNMTQRIYGGVRFIGGVLQLGAEVSFTRLGSVARDGRHRGARACPPSFTFNTSLGLDF